MHPDPARSPLWVVTSYFNPAGYQRRLQNFRSFRRLLGMPLLAMELTFDGAAPALQPGDAEILLHCDDGDVMWQKERLLNLAVAHLPATCRYVAWVDCDIVFESPHWPEAAARALERSPLVQLFDKVVHAPPDADAGSLREHPRGWSQPSVTSLFRGGTPLDDLIVPAMTRTAGTPSKGMAWAARRELLQAHGLYDKCIVGGGDTALFCAAIGAPQLAAQAHEMNAAQRDAYLGWAQPLHADVRGNLGVAQQTVFHLWHGDLADRQTKQRHVMLGAHHYDPLADLRPGRQGAWRWATEKRGLHEYVAAYFPSRLEDGRANTASPG